MVCGLVVDGSSLVGELQTEMPGTWVLAVNRRKRYHHAAMCGIRLA